MRCRHCGHIMPDVAKRHDINISLSSRLSNQIDKILSYAGSEKVNTEDLDKAAQALTKEKEELEETIKDNKL